MLREGDITELASGRIVTNSANLLLEFSDYLVSISDQAVEVSKKLVADTKKHRYPPRKLRELERALESLTKLFHALSEDFDKLEKFCSRAIDEHKARFGDQPDQNEYSPVNEAEMILQEARTKASRFRTNEAIEDL